MLVISRPEKDRTAPREVTESNGTVYFLDEGEARNKRQLPKQQGTRTFNNRLHHHLKIRLKLYVIIYSKSRSRFAQRETWERWGKNLFRRVSAGFTWFLRSVVCLLYAVLLLVYLSARCFKTSTLLEIYFQWCDFVEKFFIYPGKQSTR